MSDQDGPPDPWVTLDPIEFPALEGLFLGYLNEDFEAIYGSPEAAIDVFISDVEPEDCEIVLREWNVLRARLEAADEGQKIAVIVRLGAAWVPSSWAEVEALFDRLADVEAD